MVKNISGERVQSIKESPLNKGAFLQKKNRTKMSHLLIANKTFLSYNNYMFKHGAAYELQRV